VYSEAAVQDGLQWGRVLTDTEITEAEEFMLATR